MEIVYFSLGVVTVLLVLGVVVIVRVGTLVKELKEKVRDLERETQDVAVDLHRRIDDEVRETATQIKNTLDFIGDVKDVLHRVIDDVAKDIYQRVDEVENILDKRVDTEMRDVYSQLDSRLDKLDSKIKQKDLLKG
jgi:DNA-binding transcriptional regulator GbsR (MarR family)